jgi:hypothetical protein
MQNKLPLPEQNWLFCFMETAQGWIGGKIN